MTASKLVVSCVLAYVSCGLWLESCPAQYIRRYQPRKVTVSPYLNLTRNNNGGLPNYYALVRPQNQQREINLQEQRFQRNQAISLKRLQGELQSDQQTSVVTGTGSRFMNPGERVYYLNTTPYYPSVTLRR